MSDNAIRRRIRVQAVVSDPQTLRFILDAPVQGEAAVRYTETVADAPLSVALFAVSGVAGIEVDGASVYVTCAPDTAVETLKAPVAAALRAVLDEHAMPLGALADAPKDDDARMMLAVADLLDRQANPAIASHGGSVAVERVENGDVYLRMSGGCQGCAASAATLRSGIETMLRAGLPAIRQIIDLTDHGAGTNPFYTGAEGGTSAFNRPLPPGAIDWDGDQALIDPDYLAPKLGLTPNTLRAGLRNGDIVSISETGTGEDAGKIRLTVRTPQRAWAAEVFTDGTAREVPPPRAATPTASGTGALHHQVRRYLRDLPQADVPITYGKLARALGHWAPGSIAKITRALEATMREDAAQGAPFIAARVVSRGGDNLPAKGFFELAETLNRGPAAQETPRTFHDRLLAQLADAP